MEDTFSITGLRELFIYLANATMCIPRQHGERVFIDMAFKIHEWNDIPISKLRETLKEFDIEFHDTCSYCGEKMIDAPDDQTYCSEECKNA